MPIDATTAANAYQNQLKMMQNAGDSHDAESSGSGSTGGSTFAQMVESAAQDASSAIYKSEAHQMSSLTSSGTSGLSEMVTAVANAELTLNTVVAVRDRVINAYNDIIKMSI